MRRLFTLHSVSASALLMAICVGICEVRAAAEGEKPAGEGEKKEGDDKKPAEKKPAEEKK